MGPQSHHDTSFRILEQFFSYPSKCEHRQVGDMLWSIPVSFPISPRLLHTMSWAFMYALSAGAMEQSLRVNADVFPVSLCKPVETRSVESWMFHDGHNVWEKNRMNGWNRSKQLEKKYHFRPGSESPQAWESVLGLNIAPSYDTDMGKKTFGVDITHGMGIFNPAIYLYQK